MIVVLSNVRSVSQLVCFLFLVGTAIPNSPRRGNCHLLMSVYLAHWRFILPRQYSARWKGTRRFILSPTEKEPGSSLYSQPPLVIPGTEVHLRDLEISWVDELIFDGKVS